VPGDAVPGPDAPTREHVSPTSAGLESRRAEPGAADLGTGLRLTQDERERTLEETYRIRHQVLSDLDATFLRGFPTVEQ